MARRLPAYRPGVRLVRLSGEAMRRIGAVLVCLASVSAAVLQRGVLGLDREGAMEALGEAMKPGGQAMGWATAAVLCSLAATLAVPVFAKLLYERWQRTQSGGRLLMELAVCALASEIPYDFAMSGKLLDLSTQNPAWGLLLAAVALEIARRWKMRSKPSDIGFRAVVVVAALAWSLLLRVYMGFLLVLLPVLFCYARKWKRAVMLGSVLLTLPQFPAPVGMVFVHWYDEEKTASESRWLYIFYPLQLAAFGVLTALMRS